MIGGRKVFICLECGETFDEDEIYTWREDRGEFWGVSCSEEMSGCPYCSGNYEEARMCDCCGEWISEEDMRFIDDDIVCEECYKEYELEEEE